MQFQIAQKQPRTIKRDGCNNKISLVNITYDDVTIRQFCQDFEICGPKNTKKKSFVSLKYPQLSS